MSTKGLAVLVLLLGVGVWLAGSNPTSQDYEKFLDRLLRQAVQQLESSPTGTKPGIISQLGQSKDSVFFQSLVRSQTSRYNLGLLSLFETKVLSFRLIVVGIGGQFFPVTDPGEALKNLEKSIISPAR